MSPYRVLVLRPGHDDTEIIAAMLSKDKVTEHRNIYITQKTVPTDPTTELTSKVVAHLQTGKHNSIILDKYEIVKDYTRRSAYKVRYCKSGEILAQVELTQQDCLELAMKDYCSKHDIKIINTL